MIYRNGWKYGSPTEEVDEDEDNHDDKEDPPIPKEDVVVLEDSKADDENAVLATPVMLEQERLIADATRHVEQAIPMREMAQERHCTGTIHSAPATFRAPLLLYCGLCSESDASKYW
jgi:hypothetical protein